MTLKELLDSFPQAGKVRHILLRTEKYVTPTVVQSVIATRENGLEGDHYHGPLFKKRQVTLIQFEHLPVIASLLGKDMVAPELLRRNLVVSGINLLALKDRVFAVGDCRMQMTGLCQPCSRMEEALGPGGYNAMRGHGGITARIVQDGAIRINDLVRLAC
ncbi:MAG: MOSC domain-containing protein [Gammaproteobacteria bacterium]|nr:MOSC domain-containing protein [Gammaproteobacteria bacterium]